MHKYTTKFLTTLILALATPILCTYAETLNRARFSLDVPAGVTVDPEEPDIDNDHMTTLNLSEGSTIMFTVLDLHAKGSDLAVATTAKMAKRMNSSQPISPLQWDNKAISHSSAISGKINGMKYDVHAFALTRPAPDSDMETSIVVTILLCTSEQAIYKDKLDSVLKSFNVKK